jgi:hypothetical protein
MVTASILRFCYSTDKSNLVVILIEGKQMNCAVKFGELIASGVTTTEEALALFDQLEPAECDFMLGRWRGKGFPTGHKMDGLMEAYNWYGKIFDSVEDVHPLVFTRFNGSEVRLNPIWFPLKFAKRTRLATSTFAKYMFNAASYVLLTRKSRARLRMTEYRGKVSATMVYDALPINDVFRKVDDNTVLGVMDLKGAKKPFFFVLERAP